MLSFRITLIASWNLSVICNFFRDNIFHQGLSLLRSLVMSGASEYQVSFSSRPELRENKKILECKFQGISEILCCKRFSNPQDFPSSLLHLQRPLVSCVQDLRCSKSLPWVSFSQKIGETHLNLSACRSQVVKEACLSLACLAQQLQHRAEQLLQPLLPSLLLLLQRSDRNHHLRDLCQKLCSTQMIRSWLLSQNQFLVFTILFEKWSQSCHFKRGHCCEIHPPQLLLPWVRRWWQFNKDDRVNQTDEDDDDNEHLGL